MKHVTLVELEQMKMPNGEPIHWTRTTISGKVFGSGQTVYYPSDMTIMAFECLKCNEHYVHDKCTNCDYNVFTSGAKLGIYCQRCTSGFSSWTCECGTENPTFNTLFIPRKKGCFIATAAYGTALAPEIEVLRRFRDSTLQKTTTGRLAVYIYEQYSPPLANWISTRPVAQSLVRNMALSPIIHLIRKWQQ